MGSLAAQIELARFLELYLEDQAQGQVRELAAYQELFPEIQELVAEEFQGLLEPASRSCAKGTQTSESTRATNPKDASTASGDIARQLHQDLEEGRTPTLAAYLQLFPGRELEVADALANATKESTTSRPAAALPPAMPESLGSYRLERELGRGGQATVYLARDTKLDRPVALKVFLASALLPTSSTRQRFEREALTAARLDHPNLCAVYEVGEEGPLAYIAMRFVPGIPLSHKLANVRARTKRGHDAIPLLIETTEDSGKGETSTWTRLSRTLAIVEELARAVHVAHDAGILHRDIKPGNVMLTPEGHPVLLDFGLALNHDDESFPSLTQTGELLGTPRYMSPEQVRADGSQLDRRTDVYSLAVTLFECLTGRCPFEQKSIQQLYRHILTRDAPRAHRINADIPEDLSVVLEVALEKDRERRYATALEFAEDLRRVREHEPILARSASAVYQARKFARRHRGLVAGAITTLVASLIGTVVAVFFALKAEESAELADEREAEATQIAYRALSDSAWRAIAEGDYASAPGFAAKLPEGPKGWETIHLEAHFDKPLADLETGMGWSPLAAGFVDGVPVAVVSHEGKGELVEVGTEASLASLGPVARAYWLNEDPRLILAEGHGHVVLHDLPSGRALGTFPINDACRVVHARVASDTLVLLTDHGVVGFDVPTGELLYERWKLTWEWGSAPPGKREVVWSSGLALTGGGDGAVAFVSRSADELVLELIGLRSGEPIAELAIAELGTVHAMRESPDGNSLALVSNRGLSTYRLPSLEPELEALGPRFTPDLQRGFRGSVSYAEDGALLLVSRLTDRVLGFDVASGRLLMELGAPFDVSEARLSPGGDRLLYGEIRKDGQRVQLLRRARVPVRTLRGHDTYVYEAAFHPDGSLLATADFHGVVLVWDPLDGALVARVAATTDLWSPSELWFSADGEWLVARSQQSDAPLLAWNLVTGVQRTFASHADPERPAPSPGSVLESGVGLNGAHNSSPTATNADGLRLQGTAAGELLVFDEETGDELWKVQAHEGGVRSVAFDPAGTWLASGGRADQTVRVWSWPDGELVATLAAVEEGLLYSVAFHPDGSRLVTAGADGTLRLWDTRNFKLASELTAHVDYIHRARFSPDGSMLVSASGDSTVALRDTVPTYVRDEQARSAAREREALRPVIEAAFAEHSDPTVAVRSLLDDPKLDAGKLASLRRLLIERAFPAR